MHFHIFLYKILIPLSLFFILNFAISVSAFLSAGVLIITPRSILSNSCAERNAIAAAARPNGEKE